MRWLSLTKAHWCGALILSLMLAWTRRWRNRWVGADLRRHDAHASVMSSAILNALQWRQNGHAGVSNHRCLNCLLSSLFRRRSKKTSKLRFTGLCEGNPPGTGEFPSQRTSNVQKCFHWMTSSCDIFKPPKGILKITIDTGIRDKTYQTSLLVLCVPDDLLPFGARTSADIVMSFGPRFNIKTVFPGMWISMLMIRRSGVLIRVGRHLYIDTAPWVSIH